MVRLLITRPEPDNIETARRLNALGIASNLMPFLTFTIIKSSLPASNNFDAIALTSTNALRALEQQTMLDRFYSLLVFAVGQNTANAAEAAGFISVTAADNTLESLAQCIRTALPDGRLFYPTAKHRSGNLGTLLEPANIQTTCVPLYEMEAKSKLTPAQSTLLKNGDIGGIMFYSARTASAFTKACTNAALDVPDNMTALCLSQNVAIALGSAKFGRVIVADTPNEDAMMALALSFAQTTRK